MATQDWRIGTDAADYFNTQQKQAAIDNRRPVVRTIGDIAGPGIGANATRVTNWGDELATFDGYYSSEKGASGAPTSAEGFTGFTVSDDELGGAQIVVGLISGLQYTRAFSRAAGDTGTLGFTQWTSVVSAPSIVRLSYPDFNPPANTWTPIPAFTTSPLKIRGNRVISPADGIITVLFDGWYQIGCQMVFGPSATRNLLRVVTGTNPDADIVIALEGNTDAGASGPGMNGTSVDYFEAGTTFRLYALVTQSNPTSNTFFYVKEA